MKASNASHIFSHRHQTEKKGNEIEKKRERKRERDARISQELLEEKLP